MYLAGRLRDGTQLEDFKASLLAIEVDNLLLRQLSPESCLSDSTCAAHKCCRERGRERERERESKKKYKEWQRSVEGGVAKKC